MFFTWFAGLHHPPDVSRDARPEHRLSSLEDRFDLSLVPWVDCLKKFVSHGCWYDDPVAFEHEAILYCEVTLKFQKSHSSCGHCFR